MNVFDYIKSFNDHQYIDDLSEYNSFVINKGLSFGVDTILYANEMNLNSFLPDKVQYDYLFHSIRPRKRFNKWIKNPKEDDNLDLVKEYFGYNTSKARQALSLLSPDQLKTIRNELQKGGPE
jgi:hypothetical protein